MEARNIPPVAIESEEELLGSILVSPGALDAVLVELHLAPEHFYLEKHAELFGCMVSMHDRGVQIDEILVIDELRSRGKIEAAGGAHYVSELAARVAAVTTFMRHAEIVIYKAQWRQRLAAGQEIQQAAYDQNTMRLAKAEELLAKEIVHGSADYDPDQLADIAYEMLESDGVEAFPWPFERLNYLTAGGIRRGELVVVSGHTSHGKSVFLDQLLDSSAKRGKKVRLYMNEMDLEQRVSRALNRRTGVPYAKLVQGKTTPDDARKVMAELNRGLPWGITHIPGWTAEEVGHHIRRRRWDLAVVDHLHEFDYEGEEDLRRMISGFARVAKIANCAVVVGAQLNERRVVSNILPRPTISDIKGSSQIKQAADTVCFVYREQDPDTAEPLPQSSIYLSKGRNQGVGGMRARFNKYRLRFETVEDEKPDAQ